MSKSSPEYWKEYVKKNKKYVYARQKAWRKKNKDHCNEVKKRWRDKNKKRLNAQEAVYRDKNRDKIRKRNRDWRRKNKLVSKRWRLKKFGINIAIYEAMLKKQKGVCAICRENETHFKRSRSLCVDHCHIQGHVRGLLCSWCNSALGLFRDRPELLKRAAEYLIKGPAKITIELGKNGLNPYKKRNLHPRENV